MTIFLDSDGVLKDWNKSVFKVHNFEFDGNYPDTEDCVSKFMGITKSEMWEEVDKLGHQFWEELEDYEHTEELINLIKEYDNFIILTAPNKSPDAEKGKKLALQKRFGVNFKDYIFTPRKNKQLLAYVPGAVLIDDSPVNCKEFTENGGKTILFPHFQNRNRHVKDKIAYVREELEKIYNTSDTDMRS